MTNGNLTPSDAPSQSDTTSSDHDQDSSAPGLDQTPASEVRSEASESPVEQVSGENAGSESVSRPTNSGSASSMPSRPLGPLAARGLGIAKPASPAASKPSDTAGLGAVSTETASAAKADANTGAAKKKKQHARPRVKGDASADTKPDAAAESRQARSTKVAVPNRREGLSADLQAELEAELAEADVEAMLGGSAGMPDRKEPLGEGTRVQGRVLKIHDDSVFVALGGPDEGVVPLEQFSEAEPVPGDHLEVLVRGFNSEDGLFALTLPGATVEVSDWEDIQEGSVVEATVTGHNSGGLECSVGNIRGFIPISQVTEYRVEDLSEFVDQKLVCLVNESNERRGNLVLSRRAVLEREREEKRREQLEKVEVGDELEGTVRTIKDFGAFVDMGGIEGLIHISKLSWERVKHPSEVLEEGQRVRVMIDKLDKQTGKISLSYRDLLENPWDSAQSEFTAGTVHRGTITRVAPFGCFVRLTAGVEGLVHISELAHHRVSKVDAFVSEGQEVEVKVLSFDRESQKVALSIKAAQAVAESEIKQSDEETETDEPARDLAVKATHQGPLRGGNNRDAGGGRFGLRW